jgi:PAS domain S-box-containing protein
VTWKGFAAGHHLASTFRVGLNHGQISLPTVNSSGETVLGEASEHSVRFYERDQEVLAEVADYLDSALRSGGLAVAIATEAHRADLTRRLSGFGGTNWYPGNLVMLDAAETLERFMVDGAPEPARFVETIEPLLGGCEASKPRHAFGEMVAVLCERGQYEAALALEALWNDLLARHRFSLFCAYPKRLFASGTQARLFRHVCAAHTSVTAWGRERDGAAGEVVPSEAALREQTLALQREIELRRSAEQTLRQREQELSDFLEDASEGIHKVAADGTILYANRAELHLLGYEWDEYVGRNIANFYVDQDLIADILGRLQRGEELRDQAAILRCKDGSQKPVLIYSNACIEKGQLRYTRCFTRDASERVARDQALEQRNDLILQAPVGAALLTGQELRFELANEAYCAMVCRHDIVGRTLVEVFPELRGSPSESLLHEVMRNGQVHTTDEHSATIDLGQGPEERFFKLTLQPMRSPQGSVSGIIVVAVDITDHIRARQALERSGKEREELLAALREASRAKDDFLAMLGHELRNPLSPIVTALQLMRMRGDTGTSREQAIIQRQVDHMVRLVDDLLDISRVIQGKIELKRDRADIASVLAKAVEQASMLLEQRGHNLKIDVQAGLQCQCDAVRVAQVVANLLTNAARYTEPGGDILLRAWRDADGHLAVSVRDNGAGIAPEMLKRVFELFYQGERGLDRAEGGLGIGLALVRSLTELHGGTVEALSEGPGHGSEFIIRLPWIDCDDPAGTDHGAPLASVHDTSTKRVLLVDDNKDAGETMAEFLRMYGYQVEAFADPVSALERLTQIRPEVALLDIGLPVMDGYELGRRIAEACGSSCLLIAMTGYGQEADKARSQAAGFRHHLVKPVAPQELLDLLHQTQ